MACHSLLFASVSSKHLQKVQCKHILRLGRCAWLAVPNIRPTERQMNLRYAQTQELKHIEKRGTPGPNRSRLRTIRSIMAPNLKIFRG